jgi:hypothetical protein
MSNKGRQSHYSFDRNLLRKEETKQKDSLVEISRIVSQFSSMLYGCLLMILHAMLYGRLLQLYGVEIV